MTSDPRWTYEAETRVADAIVRWSASGGFDQTLAEYLLDDLAAALASQALDRPQPAAEPAPRTWTLPPEPGLEVTRVLDAYGQYFERHHDEHPGDDVWIGQTFAGDVDVDDLELEWGLLMAYHAPLTDATPCSTCGGRAIIRCLAHQAGDGCNEGQIPCPDCQSEPQP